MIYFSTSIVFPREQGLEAVEQFFQKSGFSEVFSNETVALDFIRNLTYDKFKQLLVDVNGVLRGLPEDRRGMSGKRLLLGDMHGNSHDPPHPKDKEHLLKEVLIAFQQLNDIQDIALLTYLGIQLLHIFDDGNGRTGRAIFCLMQGMDSVVRERNDFMKHYVIPFDAEIEGDARTGNINLGINIPIMKAVAEDILGTVFMQEYNGIHLDAPRPDTLLSEFSKSHEDWREWDNELKEEISEMLMISFLVEGFSIRDIALLKFLQEQDGNLEDSEYHKEPYGNDYYKYVKTFFLNGPKLMRELEKDDFEKIINIYRKLKQLFIRKMIDVIVHPENYPQANGQLLKDTFVR
jgi:hypothetical protein